MASLLPFAMDPLGNYKSRSKLGLAQASTGFITLQWVSISVGVTWSLPPLSGDFMSQRRLLTCFLPDWRAQFNLHQSLPDGQSHLHWSLLDGQSCLHRSLPDGQPPHASQLQFFLSSMEAAILPFLHGRQSPTPLLKAR